ncbi:MAG: InlB B-repeat-containing protein [Clostridia bacterium]|nr:InlB B-repeat-containing protein [Clostridia bacterium]
MKKFRTTHKKLLSLLLVMIMLVSIAPANLFSVTANATTNGITRSQAVSWANSKIGSSLDQDGVYGAQCADLIRFYYSYLGNSPVSGNGCDYANNSLPSGWTRIQYYNGFVPQPGDIAVWTYTTSSYGHVAIITSADASTMYVVEQNGSTGVTRSHSYSYSFGTFWGVIRPDFVSDATTVPENPQNLRTSTGAKKFTTAEYITFNWDASAGATNYWIYMWKDGVQIYDTDMGNSISFTSAPTSVGKYTFIVRAGNSLGYCVGVSYAFDVVENEIPDAPTGLTTTDGRTEFTTEESISFKWNESKRATEYWIYMWKDGKQLYQTNMGNNMTFTSAPTSVGKYTLIVRAGNTAGFGSDGDSFKFTVYDPNQTVNIAYNPNGGENAPANQTKKYDEDITLSSTKPTRDGYVFLGWSTDSDSDIIDYFPGDTYSENKDITLYAVWKKNIYIEGNLKTFGESTDDIVFTFVSDDEYENTYIVPIDGDASVYSIMGINPGEYILTVSKENHVSAEYYVDLTADATLDIQLNLIGDINGDGKINVVDYSSVLRHAKKTENLEDYAFLCADVDGNGRVTVSDYARILRHVKKTDPLW